MSDALVPPVRRRLRAAVVIAVAAATVAGVLALGASDGSEPTTVARDGAPPVAAQVGAGADARRLGDRIAASWLDRRAASGLYVDPVSGGSGHGYGPAMLAEAQIRAGARRGDRRLLRAGLRALSVNATRAASDGLPGNPLELLAIASAYRWADRNLAGDRAWSRAALGPRDYLRKWEHAAVGPRAARCFASSSCWNNYKIIDAAAVLLLLDTELRPASPASRLADADGARAAAMSILERDLPRSIGRDARALGPDVTMRGLGLLSDQPNYPLAYHAMSVAALARALRVLGDAAPAAARESFRRAMLAEASFMAPDGDITYLGRAQGESWALAATAYAGEACAHLHERSDPPTAGICATLAIRAMRRLRRLHGVHDGLLAIVPRFRNSPPTGGGLEHYVRVMTFNGLTATFLEWAGDEASAARSVVPAPLPLDAGGSFIDPHRAHIAVVRHDSIWFAVHAIGPIGVVDLRDDFGVLALKRRRSQRWVDVMPPRPFDELQTTPDSGGPALMTPGGLAFPNGRRFSVSQDGEVVIHGGYRNDAARSWAERAEFRVKPTRRGVTFTATAPPGSVLRFQDFLPPRWTKPEEDGSVLLTPTAASRLSQPPSVLEHGSAAPSANGGDLLGYRRYVTVPRSGLVRWTLTARSQRP